MGLYIITGCYTAEAAKGLINHPSDREAAVRPLIAAGGGKLISFLITTGETDFSMVIETDDLEGMMASLIVAGATGTVSNLKTVQAFTSAQFLAAQKKAGQITAKFKAAGQG
uniref:GYD domain-containing protein n=1 Tax=Pararhizobium sp. IMCC3301 TaxID=3067904 RepID=UPI002740B022|nr:GYD domain-containing protein [Pararhizobium sp. IMCC3301]